MGAAYSTPSTLNNCVGPRSFWWWFLLAILLIACVVVAFALSLVVLFGSVSGNGMTIGATVASGVGMLLAGVMIYYVWVYNASCKTGCDVGCAAAPPPPRPACATGCGVQ